MRIVVAVIVLAARIVSADPALQRVVTAPTAWLPAQGAVVAGGSVDHRGDGAIDVGYGLAGLAAIDVGTDTDIRACLAPPCGTDNRAEPMWLGRAAFKLGIHQHAWLPALAFGVRETFAAHPLPGFAHPRVGEAYAVASLAVGRVTLHGGAMASDASFRDAGGEHRMGLQLRPLGAIELVPPQYPKTTLLADLAWVPRLEHDAPVLEWLGGIAVRYQAFPWGSIDLTFRHREAEGLGASTVLVRVDGVWER
jgi:hypothetical protein